MVDRANKHARRIAGMAAAVGLSVAVSSCNMLTGSSSTSGLQFPVEPTGLTGERLIGAKEHPRVLKAFGGVYRDPAGEKVIARIVGRLVAASEVPSLSYQITILNSPAVNAFALPGGYLYVTRGLMALANDSSEIAAVLAHEMAHVTTRHASARQQRAEAAELVNRVVANVVQDRDAATATLASSRSSFARFTQTQELEADRVGIATLARGGYDPFAAARFLTSMERFAAYKTASGDTNTTADFLSSHPTTPTRINSAVRAARQVGAPGLGLRQKAAYLQSLDGMMFGDDPSEGFVRGRTFLHKRLRISFNVPTGFRLENSPKAVLAINRAGVAMRFDGVEAPSGQSMVDYLNSGWINGLDVSSVEKMSSGALQGAIAGAHADDWYFRIAVFKAGGSVYRFIFAAKSDSPAFDASFRETWSSFRRLTVQQALRLRTLKIKVVRVKPGQTIDTLTPRMGGIDRSRHLFIALNGMDTDTPLKIGDWVKLVSE
jgi:predicted Zn-dependent protease